MKNGYSGVESSELIQKYETFNDTIVITFLDDSTYEIPLTEENKKYLLNQMLEQTKERSESSALADAKKIRKKAILWSFVQAGFTMLNFIAANADSNHMKLFACLGGITSVTLLVGGIAYKFSNDEIKELEKYDIYLAIRQRLEQTADPNLFNGIERRDMKLNINTLDNYSLSEIKRIRTNLERNTKYSKYLKETDKEPTLVKKF